MTPRQIAALALRIFALYALLLSFPFFSRCFTHAAYALHLLTPPHSNIFDLPLDPADYNIWSTVNDAVLPSLFVGFALLLWIFADGIAVFMAAKPSNTPGQIDSRSLHAIAFSCVGLFVVVINLSTLIKLLYDILHAFADRSIMVWTQLPYDQVIIALTQTLFGMWLIFGGQGLVNLIHSARDLGRDPIPAEESSSD